MPELVFPCPWNVDVFPASYFACPTLEVARGLIGAWLVHEHPRDGRLAGRIVETEAYTQDDPAFRSWGVFDEQAGLVRPEGRALDLFGPPGRAYVYTVFGHWLLNVVTEPEGRAGCVLIRAVEPLRGRDAMARRRPAAQRDTDLASGPGKLCQAFGIDRRFHERLLTAPPLYLAAPAEPFSGSIATSARVGLHFGIDLPYRFFVDGHPHVSPGAPGRLR